ncbi:MAG: hypothetical protein HYT80_09230 [Euryarchaeota archaeon]|nr:hypothetical protein [Euryarchaeota archaeon]
MVAVGVCGDTNGDGVEDLNDCTDPWTDLCGDANGDGVEDLNDCTEPDVGLCGDANGDGQETLDDCTGILLGICGDINGDGEENLDDCTEDPGAVIATSTACGGENPSSPSCSFQCDANAEIGTYYHLVTGSGPGTARAYCGTTLVASCSTSATAFACADAGIWTGGTTAGYCEGLIPSGGVGVYACFIAPQACTLPDAGVDGDCFDPNLVLDAEDESITSDTTLDGTKFFNKFAVASGSTVTAPTGLTVIANEIDIQGRVVGASGSLSAKTGAGIVLIATSSLTLNGQVVGGNGHSYGTRSVTGVADPAGGNGGDGGRVSAILLSPVVVDQVTCNGEAVLASAAPSGRFTFPTGRLTGGKGGQGEGLTFTNTVSGSDPTLGTRTLVGGLGGRGADVTLGAALGWCASPFVASPPPFSGVLQPGSGGGGGSVHAEEGYAATIDGTSGAIFQPLAPLLTAIGGNGGDSGGAFLPSGGFLLTNIGVADSNGGWGGNATADGTKGLPSCYQCSVTTGPVSGIRGISARAVGGSGGNGPISGDGGDATALAGPGGAGANGDPVPCAVENGCPPSGAGKGGDGGDADAVAGDPGEADECNSYGSCGERAAFRGEDGGVALAVGGRGGPGGNGHDGIGCIATASKCQDGGPGGNGGNGGKATAAGGAGGDARTSGQHNWGRSCDDEAKVCHWTDLVAGSAEGGDGGSANAIGGRGGPGGLGGAGYDCPSSGVCPGAHGGAGGSGGRGGDAAATGGNAGDATCIAQHGCPAYAGKAGLATAAGGGAGGKGGRGGDSGKCFGTVACTVGGAGGRGGDGGENTATAGHGGHANTGANGGGARHPERPTDGGTAAVELAPAGRGGPGGKGSTCLNANDQTCLPGQGGTGGSTGHHGPKASAKGGDPGLSPSAVATPVAGKGVGWFVVGFRGGQGGAGGDGFCGGTGGAGGNGDQDGGRTSNADTRRREYFQLADGRGGSAAPSALFAYAMDGHSVPSADAGLTGSAGPMGVSTTSCPAAAMQFLVETATEARDTVLAQ